LHQFSAMYILIPAVVFHGIVCCVAITSPFRFHGIMTSPFLSLSKGEERPGFNYLFNLNN